jgi:hypothetical protein
MNKDQKNNLLNKYYRGETTLQEEAILREEFLNDEHRSPERDAFMVYREEGRVPEDLEDAVFETIQSIQIQRKRKIRWITGILSAAASVLVVLGCYLGFQEKKSRDMEYRFHVMEQAMYRVSETIQPREPEDMLVLWVDDNVEIIIQ